MSSFKNVRLAQWTTSSFGFVSLFRTPPVFGLHFVGGLPDNDVRNYAFSFKGTSYSITTVIQYDQQLKHFVTWICQSDGRCFKIVLWFYKH